MVPRTIPPGGDSAKQIIDEADASTTYVGWALRGTATSEAKWLIKRILVSGTTTTTEWASTKHDQEWDDRATLSYS